MNSDNQYHLSFLILECLVNVHCDSLYLQSILRNIYGAMHISDSDNTPDLEYKITQNNSEQGQFSIFREGTSELTTNDEGEFIFLFEKDMTIELQKIRSDLIFIHAAALEFNGVGFLLVAPSGTGKSTTTWGLVNSGFNYLSDELAPIDPNTMLLHSYPHALCLKDRPPMFELPGDCLFTSQTIHVYGGILSEKIQLNPVLLKAVIFLEYHPDNLEPEILMISRGDAASHLYVNSLNILAHSNSDYGMAAVIKIAKQTHNYRLFSNQLDKTSDKLKSLIQSIE